MNTLITNIQSYLVDLSYPASKQEIIRYAQSNGADIDTIDALESIEDRTYSDETDLMESMSYNE